MPSPLDRLFAALKRRPSLTDDGAPTSQSQQQREALIDLLVCMMFADRHIASPEQQEVQRRADELSLSWEAALGVDVFIDASVRRARAALGDEAAAERYLDEITARLAEPSARAEALGALEAMAAVDGEVSAAETALLDKVRAKLA